MAKTNGRIYTSQHSENGALVKWHLKDVGANTNIIAKRTQNTIIIEGTFKGAKINKRIEIDNNPWYQIVSFSLTQFVKSDQSSVTFWALKTDSLEPFKMRATKLKKQELSLQEENILTQRVRVKLTGFKALFWYSDYWFRESDGLFLKYRGVEGPPPTPETTVTLVSFLP